ncbi:PEPxxWA-CTERM sorting domain-containing protein [Sphingomonas sp. DBB INV C78]|uniref:PEPxxWA-CTERM sorting domain-containing protein n=1 Tax=Sphingomonas sp. DBB INV C78 TaxID=3349434 RepID=UPI0036D2DCB3
MQIHANILPVVAVSTTKMISRALPRSGSGKTLHFRQILPWGRRPSSNIDQAKIALNVGDIYKIGASPLTKEGLPRLARFLLSVNGKLTHRGISMKFAFLKFAAAAALGIAAVAPAQAATTFQIDTDAADTYVNVTSFDQIGFTNFTASLASLPGAFSLEEGESFTFDFATLNIGGFLGAGTASLEAKLSFLTPGGSGTSEGDGFYVKGFVVSGGGLNWEDIAPITIGGATYQVEFSDLAGLSISNPKVKATVTLISEGVGSPVPEPAAWAMLITGFGMVGGAMRMRQPRRALAA